MSKRMKSSRAGVAMSKIKEFGACARTGDGVQEYELSNGALTIRVITLGATITSVQTPDLNGEAGEIALGYDDAKPYSDGTSPYFGCVAGRVANRIAKGTFVLDGSSYKLATNNGPNHLHGGDIGFDKRLWRMVEGTSTSLTLEYASPDGEEGYPGKLVARVTYSLPDAKTLQMEYTATCDAPTLCNLTNHTYWNLKDGGASPVLDHTIELDADFYTPVDDTSIPIGDVRPVSGAMDLRKRMPIGQGIREADNGMGYDHNYCLSGALRADGLRAVARVHEPSTGRWMAVHTDQPGVQFYTGNYLDGTQGRDGSVTYGKHHGFCLETQTFPDAANRPHFPPALLRPGQTYAHKTVHTFGASAAPPPPGSW
jgi:aldose 1-epimerase